MTSSGWQLALGILLIVVGGLYPLAAAYRMNRRLGRPEGPTVTALLWWLAFTLSFPFALALTGVGLILPHIGGRVTFQAIVGGLWGVAVISGLTYWILQLRSRRRSRS